MSVPNVNCKIRYSRYDNSDAKSAALKEKYDDRRKYYSCNQTQDYLTYMDTGSKEKIDYLSYAGDSEKSCGAFGKNKTEKKAE